MARLLEAVPFDSACRYQSCALGELIADALCAWASPWDHLDQPRPHVCLVPTASIGQAGLVAGGLSEAALAELLPPERLIRATIGHGALRRALSRSATTGWESCDRSAFQVSGVRLLSGCHDGDAAELMLEGGEREGMKRDQLPRRISLITLPTVLPRLGLNPNSSAVERLGISAREAFAAYVRARTPLGARTLAATNPHPGRLALHPPSCGISPPCARERLGAAAAATAAASVHSLSWAFAASPTGSPSSAVRSAEMPSVHAASYAASYAAACAAFALLVAALALRRSRCSGKGGSSWKGASYSGASHSADDDEALPLCGGSESMRSEGDRLWEKSLVDGIRGVGAEGGGRAVGGGASPSSANAAACSCRNSERRVTGGLRLISQAQLGE